MVPRGIREARPFWMTDGKNGQKTAKHKYNLLFEIKSTNNEMKAVDIVGAQLRIPLKPFVRHDTMIPRDLRRSVNWAHYSERRNPLSILGVKFSIKKNNSVWPLCAQRKRFLR